MAERARRTLAGLGAAALLLSGPTACGSDESDYCAAYVESRQELADLATRQSEAAEQGGDGVDVLTPTLQSFERLREQAPDELRDEWDTLVFAYQDLADAVERTGLDPADFRVGQEPDGLSRRERRDLTAVAAELGAPRVVEAANGIEEHAAQVCEEPAPDDGSS